MVRVVVECTYGLSSSLLGTFHMLTDEMMRLDDVIVLLRV